MLGHAEKFALARPCDVEEKLMRGCGDRRQLQVLQWSRQNAGPWEEALCLGIAVQESHAAVVRRMIDAGADLNKAMNDGVTPLHIAAGRGHAAIFQILREAGAV